jgi:hypothetical protein
VELYEPKAGDNYDTISREFYNDPRYSRALAAYNRNKQLTGGGHVEVPPIHVLRKKFPTLIGTSADPLPGPSAVLPVDAKAPAAVPPAAPVFGPAGKRDDPAPVFRSTKPLTYTVRSSGINIPAVAKVTLGSELRWKEIWDLNPQITAAGEYLQLGTELKLPPDAKLPE